MFRPPILIRFMLFPELVNKFFVLLLMSAVLTAFPSATEASPFNKCVIDGLVTYQQGPCPTSGVRSKPSSREPLLQEMNAEEQRRRSVGANKLFPTSRGFACDGRQYCSQMSSCAEAKYFLANCPGVKMDGDKNGVPCEKQWCAY